MEFFATVSVAFHTQTAGAAPKLGAAGSAGQEENRKKYSKTTETECITLTESPSALQHNTEREPIRGKARPLSASP